MPCPRPVATLRPWRPLCSLALAATVSVLPALAIADGKLPDLVLQPAATTAGGAHAPDVAATADGAVRAVERLGMRSYFAIPYAAAPIADLRWRTPVAPAKWSVPLAKAASAPPCVQTGISPIRLSAGQEDCLYLDVHAPTATGVPFPVLVWLHGGALNTGGTSTYQDPSPLVSQGVVVVNVAYRLGAFGFLAHPSLNDEKGRGGNYGILDQQAALRWVRSNIAAFGGDAANVTLAGESGGGLSVMTHLASPLSKGLFDKAIVQGGAYGLDRQMTQATLEGYGQAIINSALPYPGPVCPRADGPCLRTLPLAMVAGNVSAHFTAHMPNPVPVIDGDVLPRSIKAIFQAGENQRVPVLHGTNQDAYATRLALAEFEQREMREPPDRDVASTKYVTSAAAYAATLADLAAGTNASAATLSAAYPLSRFGGASDALAPTRGITAMGTDVVFACPALQFSRRLNAQGSPVWMYEFRDRTALPAMGGDGNGKFVLSTPLGAAQSHEVQSLFNLQDLRNAERRELRDAMARYWANFARTGDPNRGAPVKTPWPRFEGDGTGSVLGLDVASGGGIRPLATSFDAAHQCGTTWQAVIF